MIEVLLCIIAALLAAIGALVLIVWDGLKERLDHLDECLDSLKVQVSADHADFRERIAVVETKLDS